MTGGSRDDFGLRKKVNRDYLTVATALFLKRYLPDGDDPGSAVN